MNGIYGAIPHFQLCSSRGGTYLLCLPAEHLHNSSFWNKRYRKARLLRRNIHRQSVRVSLVGSHSKTDRGQSASVLRPTHYCLDDCCLPSCDKYGTWW